MRFVITGGTGFVGRRLVSVLRERGVEVAIVSRTSGPGHVPWQNVGEVVDGADAVVHLAGESVAGARWSPARLERIRSSRVDTTRSIAEHVARAAKKPRVFVSASAIGVYGMHGADAPRVTESSPPADDTLARIVVAWEQAADAARAAGVRVAHPRFGVVLGRGGGALEQMAAPYRWFVGGPLGDGAQWVSWVDIRDVVRALLFIVDHESLSGPINVVAPEPVTMNALADAIGRAMRRPSFFRVPPIALKVALGEGLAQVLLTGQRVVAERLASAGFLFDFPSLEACLAREV